VSVGRVLKGLREARGLSQRGLAAKAKVTGAYVAMLETGTKKNPSLDILRRLAKALGVPVTELLG
jgi:transcriptional regulator with XRE-family HTH domain